MTAPDPLVEPLMEHLAEYGDEAVHLRADLRPRYAAKIAQDMRDRLVREIEDVWREWDEGAGVHDGKMPIAVLIGRIRGNA